VDFSIDPRALVRATGGQVLAVARCPAPKPLVKATFPAAAPSALAAPRLPTARRKGARKSRSSG
jgi:hypothetical protein